MSNIVRGEENKALSMKEYEFTCSECGQQIAVNEEMMRAILTNGCPVCAASVTDSDFEV